MAPITALPIELIEQICEHLEPHDLFTLRLTCNDIETKSLRIFAEKWFSNRRFMISRQSLDTLLYISYHPAFQKSMMVLMFSTERPREPDHVYPKLVREDYWQEKKARYDEAMADYTNLVEKGEDVSMISQAVRNLKNLKAIGVHADFDEGAYGFNSWTRYCGYPAAIQTEKEDQHVWIRLLTIILRALDRVHISPWVPEGYPPLPPNPTRSFELTLTIARDQSDRSYIDWGTACDQLAPLARFNNALEMIHGLKLQLCHRREGRFNPENQTLYKAFLAAMTQLQNLHLMYKSPDHVRAAGRTPRPITNLFAPIIDMGDFSSTKLVRLRLEKINFNTAELVNLLLRNKTTLRRLSLVGSCSSERNYQPILATIHDELDLDHVEVFALGLTNLIQNLLVFPEIGVAIPSEYSNDVLKLSCIEHHGSQTMKGFLAEKLLRMRLLGIAIPGWTIESIPDIDEVLYLIASGWKMPTKEEEDVVDAEEADTTSHDTLETADTTA